MADQGEPGSTPLEREALTPDEAAELKELREEKRKREIHDREQAREELARARSEAKAAELEAGRMPFFEHLRDLRKRLRNSIIALIVGFVVAYIFKEELLSLLVVPLANVQADLSASNSAIAPTVSLHFTSVDEPFWTFFSLSFWAGLFVASPVVFYQLWKFIAPGLYKGERRIGVWFAASAALLFIGGASFCYFFVFEPVFRFLLDFSTANMAEISKGLGVEYEVGGAASISPMLTIGPYLAFAKKILIGFGLAFELPLVIFFLSLVGMVDHRKLWKFNRWAVIVAFVLAATLTPPDVVSQSFLAGPIIVLYNISIIISFFVTRARERKEKAMYGVEAPPDDSSDDDSSDDSKDDD